jgi:hypothetical protein
MYQYDDTEKTDLIVSSTKRDGTTTGTVIAAHRTNGGRRGYFNFGEAAKREQQRRVLRISMYQY